MYRHTQVGIWLPVMAASIIGAIAWTSGSWERATTPAIVMLAVTALFSTLTTTVDGGVLVCRFGPIGLFSRRFQLADIRQARVVRASPLWGWGMRWTPHGWLWNVSGLDAVVLELTNGRRFLIGTDEPQQLVDAIRREGERMTKAAFGRRPVR